VRADALRWLKISCYWTAVAATVAAFMKLRSYQAPWQLLVIYFVLAGALLIWSLGWYLAHIERARRRGERENELVQSAVEDFLSHHDDGAPSRQGRRSSDGDI
jgi:hypothetical protein